MEIIGLIVAVIGLGLYLTGLQKANDAGEEIIRKNKQEREAYFEKVRKDGW